MTLETRVIASPPPKNPELALAPTTVLFDETRIDSPPVSPPSGVGGTAIMPLTTMVSGPGILSLAYMVNCASASASAASTTTGVLAPPPRTPPSRSNAGAASVPPSSSPPRSLIVAKPIS